jgi:hypothetical protein
MSSRAKGDTRKLGVAGWAAIALAGLVSSSVWAVADSGSVSAAIDSGSNHASTESGSGLVATDLDAALQEPAHATGQPIEFEMPPEGADSWEPHCSQHHPLCVRASPGTAPEVDLGVLAAADRAWEAWTTVVSAPPPQGWLGAPWGIYLVPAVEGGAEVKLEGRNPVARYDQGQSFALIERTTPPGCALDLALARAVARGALWRAAPATDEGSARAEAEALARLCAPSCAGSDGDFAAFQAEPERSLVDSPSRAYGRGASAFFEWADSSFGAKPGGLLTGLWALAVSLTLRGAPQWAVAPTTFDVLSASLRGALFRDSTFDDVLVRFAVQRASMVPPVRLAWRIRWPERARRLAAPEPIAPTGASYVLIEHAGAPENAKLRLELEWEDYGRLRWVALKCGAAGRVLAEVPIASLDRGTRASLTLEGLEGVDYVLVVGVNVGSTEHGFNPAQGEWEPHGWLLTVEAL